MRAMPRTFVRWGLAIAAMRLVSYPTMLLTVPKARAALRPPFELLPLVDAAAWLALTIATSWLAGAWANAYLKRRDVGAEARG